MSSSCRASVSVVFALAALAAASSDRVLARQSRVASERPAGLTVDFAAVRGDGTPVDDLRSSEVEVRINNRVRKLSSLRRVATAPAPLLPGAAVRVPPPYGTNDSVAAGRSFALIVDQESFTAGREPLLRDAVEGLLAQLTAADQAMVAALPFGGVRLPFTSDTMRIRLAIRGVTGQGIRDETGSDLACRTRRFLESLDGFLETQAGRPSPLTVVLFTAGLAGPRRDAPIMLAPGMCELPITIFQHITKVAGAARANFYLAQPTDIGMQGALWKENIAGVGHAGSDNPLEGIEHLTGATGGARVPLDAAGTASLLRVARETSAFYEAEIEPERGEVFGRSRPLAVRVSRPGVTVRVRPEITFAERRLPARTTARLTVPDLLASRAALTDLPLRAAGFTVRESDGRLRLGVVIEPVDSAATLDSVGAALVDSTGRIVSSWFAPDPMQRPLLGAMRAQPGAYRLRVVAIDKGGRAGAAEDVVEVGLTSVGPLSLGSLILGVAHDDGFDPRLEFGSEPSIVASFDIYGGQEGMPLTPTLEIARDLDGPAIAAVPLALRAGESRVVATGVVPLGALPPGEYVVRGVIRLEDATTGRVVRTLKKVAR